MLNMTKLIIVGVLALACIVALIIDSGNQDWAVPVLTALVGYIGGNAALTSRTGNTAPIIDTRNQ